MELCHVSDPLLIWFVRIKVPIQLVRRDLADFTLVRLVLLHSHKTLDSLVVQENIAAAQICCNTAVTVSTFVFVIYSCNFCLGSFLFV